MRYTLKITEEDFKELETLLWSDGGVESAAFLLAGVQQLTDQLVLLVRRVVEIPANLYKVRTRHRIELSTRAINGLAALCEANGLVPVLAHSHPDSVPYSPSDDHGEHRIAGTLQASTPRTVTGSLLMTPDRIYGRVWTTGNRPSELEEVIVIGRNLRRIHLRPDMTTSVVDSPMHTRQILAFGEPGQAAIAACKTAVVGTGGTGSPVAEQLTRLGVRDIKLIDRDIFEVSNASRVYGSRPTDARRPWWKRLFNPPPSKVDVVARYLRRINPAATIKAVHGDVTGRDVARELLDRDVIFCCTDEHWGRSVINQLAYQYLIPTLNLGVAITGGNGHLAAGIGSVQVLRPNHGCLWCCGFLNSDRIRAEALPQQERQELEAEGYLVGISDPAPSVITLTTTIAGLACTWFIQLTTDYMDSFGDFSRLNYDMFAGTVRRGRIAPSDNCICQRVRGFGDLRRFPASHPNSPRSFDAKEGG